MNVSEISAAMEAVLFACGSPVQKERLTELFDILVRVLGSRQGDDLCFHTHLRQHTEGARWR